MIGLGYRRDMLDWDMSALQADFIEVAPENWLRRDRQPLLAWRALGREVRLHGVCLNLGGTSALDRPFVRSVGALMQELQTTHYSDHLAASGDAHQLYDLFPIETTPAEVIRVSDRIAQVQDILGLRMAVENSTWYTNRGTMAETDFISAVIERADCQLLLDLNNVVVNHKNHGRCDLSAFLRGLDLSRVSYVHVAGHEFDARFGMYIDTHSRPVEPATARAAGLLHAQRGLDLLLERDHDLPGLPELNEELACLRAFTTM